MNVMRGLWISFISCTIALDSRYTFILSWMNMALFIVLVFWTAFEYVHADVFVYVILSNCIFASKCWNHQFFRLQQPFLPFVLLNLVKVWFVDVCIVCLIGCGLHLGRNQNIYTWTLNMFECIYYHILLDIAHSKCRIILLTWSWDSDFRPLTQLWFGHVWGITSFIPCMFQFCKAWIFHFWIPSGACFKMLIISWFICEQRDNVANQREHLILLLASAQTRMGFLPDTESSKVYKLLSIKAGFMMVRGVSFELCS